MHNNTSFRSQLLGNSKFKITAVQVVRAHDGQHMQIKACQQMLKDSYACRTFNINFTHTQMEALIADAMALLAHCPRCPVRVLPCMLP